MKRRTACFLMALSIALSLIPMTAMAEEPVTVSVAGAYSQVDLNGDNAVDVLDMACLYTYLSTGENEGRLSNDAFFAAADVNSDDTINILDYQALYQLLNLNPISPLAQTHVAAALSKVSGVEPFSDHWADNNISADLREYPGLAYSLTVSDATTFAKAPACYDQNALLEWGKEPGLGVDILREFGYTGEGAVIAYVDQPIAQPFHPEYAETNLHYVNTAEEEGADNSMHGPAVLSLLAGKNIGTAPDAEVYFYGHAAWKADQTTHAACLYQIIEQNKTLPAGEKIRMVGFSDNIDDSEANPDAFRDAVAACEEAGIMVWFCGEYGAGSFLPLSDKNDPENLTWDSWAVGMRPELVFVPAGSRTSAATMGGAEYIYWGSGGLSWTMPYMLGLYADAIAIDPTLTQDDIRSLVISTACTNSAGMRIIDPVAFIAAVLDRAGESAKADALRQAAQTRKKYLYAVMDTAAMTKDDLIAVANYLSCYGDAAVLVVDAAQFSDAPSLYAAIRTDHRQRGGEVTGVQIFGTPSMVPAFSVQYKVQMPSDVDNGGTFLTDLFYGNLDNKPEYLKNYNVCDHFAQNWPVELTPDYPVARLPLSAGEFTDFFDKYEDFALDTQLFKLTLANFSNPIFAQAQHTDDMGAFLNRMHDEFQLIDDDYLLYGNQRGDYPVTTAVLDGFTAANLTAVNQTGPVEFLINSHGQDNNIDCCYFEGGQEKRESLINSNTISSVLGSNPYYLDCWTCNNGWGMADNLITTALTGECVGAFAATAIISNNGVNCQASLSQMQQSNFYYFYYTYLKELNAGKSRSQAFYAAQAAYAAALLADSANGIRGDGNYQFNLCNLLAYENFGVLENSFITRDMYRSTGYITQAGQSVPKDIGGGDDPGTYYFPASPLSDGVPVGEPWTVAYDLYDEDCPNAEEYTIYSLQAQQLDNGMIRMTMEFKAPAGLQADAFNPPSGDLFMLFSEPITGRRQTFIYDLAYEDLVKTERVTSLFFGSGVADKERVFVFINAADILSGYDEALAPAEGTLNYGCNDSRLTQSEVTVHDYRYEKLDSGDYRFYLDVTASEGMLVFAFDPPDGDTFGIWQPEPTTGTRQTISYDLTAAQIHSVSEVTVSIHTRENGDNDSFFVFFRTDQIK